MGHPNVCRSKNKKVQTNHVLVIERSKFDNYLKHQDNETQTELNEFNNFENKDDLMALNTLRSG